MIRQDKRFEQALEPWTQVADQADLFFGRALGAFHKDIHCKAGCSACCQQDLSVLLVEGIAVLSQLQLLPQSRQDALAESAVRRGDSVCAFLEGDRCVVYDRRPLICRTHGLPIAESMKEPGEGQVAVSCCELNFAKASPPRTAIMNGTLLTARLTVANSLAQNILDWQETERISLRQIVIKQWDAFPEGRVRRLINTSH